jgi:hypothetical protein
MDLLAGHLAEIAPEGCAIGDGDLLKAPADAEYWPILLYGSLDDAQDGLVTGRIKRTGSLLRGTVTMRRDIGWTAGQQDAVQTSDDRADVKDVAHRRHQDGVGTHEGCGAQVAFSHRLHRILGQAGATGDADERPLCHDHKPFANRETKTGISRGSTRWDERRRLARLAVTPRCSGNALLDHPETAPPLDVTREPFTG